jgi:hypothetical protein
MLYASAALIQDNRFFATAPKDIRDAIVPRTHERFSGAHALGWFLTALSILGIAGALVIGIRDGMAHNFTFMQYFSRFLTMLVILKIFDVLFIDLFLLCNSQFFQHYYPETEGCEGYSSFGWNYKDHLIQLVLAVPLSLLLAWVGTML